MAKTPKSKAKKTPAIEPTPATVGAVLKERRLGHGMTLGDAERATRIRGKYLVAIEADDYRELPHDVYTRGFVQSYARHLGLDAADIVRRYGQQRGKQELQLRRASGINAPRVTLTPRLLTAVGSLVGAALIGAYLVWQLSALTAPPKLDINNPVKDQVLYGSLIEVSGHVAGGADVFVNDSPILVDDNGDFTDAIALQDGVNSIHVSAKNRLGKSTTVTRNILAHVPKTDPNSILPTSPFDGVAVSVNVQGRTATLTIKIDGKEAFRGTMLPNTTQTFKGKSSVEISTTDAGATHLTVTNQIAANKDLGAIGQDRQSKSGFQFDKDTQFQ